MKSHGVTIQMKPLQQYFHMVLFIQYAVLTFESADEILLPFICYLFCRTFTLQFIYHVVLPFESVDEIL